jgi:predicted amidophosphoribosyltransferase
MRRLAVPLASILAQFLQGEDFCGPIDFVAPLPLHPSKEAARGYNQSALIGEVLAGEMGIHFEARLLERTRPTRPQSKLPREERVGNVRGAFRTLGDPSGRAVLLIDDVMTTGATLREASAALNGAGAKEVYCLCVAKDLLRMPRR